MHYAAARGHLEVASWLLDEQSVPHSPADESGVTPLHLAATGPSEVVLITLLRAGADPNRKDTRGHTPLSLAAGRTASSKGAVAGTAASATALMREAIATPTAPPRPRIVLLRPGVLGVELEAPMGGPAAPPVDGLQVERAQRGMLGLGAWVEVDEGALRADATSTELGFVKADAVLAARVRARNRNGWGAWSANSEETSMGKLAEAAKAGRAEDRDAAEAQAAGAAAADGDDDDSARDTVSGAASGRAAPEAVGQSNGASSPGLRRQRDRLDEAAATAAVSGDVAGLAEAEKRGVNVLTGVWAKPAAPWAAAESPAVAAVAAEAPAEAPGSAVERHLGLGRTALHMAVSEGQAGVARWLARRALEQLADEEAAVSLVLEARDAKGATPMLLAVVAGHLTCARLLASSGASLDTCDLKGFSALHYAAHKGHTRLFCWLLEAGADPDARTKSGKTVESMAASMRAAAAMLSSARAPPPAPPPPVFLAASRYALALELPALRLAPGCPRPLEVEISYGPKFALLAGSITTRVPYEATRSETRGEDVSGMRVLLPALSPDTAYTIRSRARSVRGWGGWCSRPLEVSTRPASDRRGIPPGLIRGRGRAGDADGASVSAAPAAGASSPAGAGKPKAGSRLGQLLEAEAEDGGSVSGSGGRASPISATAARFGMGGAGHGGLQLGAPASIVLDGPPIADVPGMLEDDASAPTEEARGSPDPWLGALAPRVEASLLRDARAAIVAASDGLQSQAKQVAAPGGGSAGRLAAQAGAVWGAVVRTWSPKTLLQSCGPALRRARRSVLRRAAVAESGAVASDDAGAGSAEEDAEAAASADAVVASLCVSAAATGTPTALCWVIGLRARDLVCSPHASVSGVGFGPATVDGEMLAAVDTGARSDSDDDGGLPAFGAEPMDARPASAGAGAVAAAGDASEVDFVSGGGGSVAASASAAARARRRRRARLRRAAAVLRMVFGSAKYAAARTVAMAAASGSASEPAVTALPASALSAVTIAASVCLAADADPGRFVAAALVSALAGGSDAATPEPAAASDPSAALTEEAEAAAVLSAMAAASGHPADGAAPGAADCGGLAHAAAFGASLPALRALDAVASLAGYGGARGPRWCGAERDGRGASALHYAAAAGGSSEAVAALAAALAPSLPEDSQGRSPLHWAAASRRPRAVAALLGAVMAGAGDEAAGTAAVLKAAMRADASGVTPLHVAAGTAAASCLVLLLSAVAGSAGSAGSLAAVQSAVTVRDDAGRTTLSIAADSGDAGVLAVLRAWLQPPPPCTGPKLDARPSTDNGEQTGDGAINLLAYRLLSEGTAEAIGDASDAAMAAPGVRVLSLAPVTAARVELRGSDGVVAGGCDLALPGSAEQAEGACGAVRVALSLTPSVPGAGAGPAVVGLVVSGAVDEDGVAVRLRLRTGAGWSAWSAWSTVFQQ